MNDEIYDVENLPATRDEEAQLPDAKRMLAITIERARHLEIIHKLVISVTLPSDWIDYGGKPGISGPGVERIMRVAGLQAFNKKREKIVNEDGSYIWQVTGQIGRENEVIDIIGTCASSKPFFAKRDGVDIPTSEVDESNIKKNADTNFYVNGVSRFLGLRGLTWVRLDELSEGKLSKDKGQKVDFKSGKTERTEEETTQAKIIWKWLLDMNGNSVQNAKEQLQKCTKFNDFKGYTDINKVSSKMIEKLYTRIEKLYDQWGSDQTTTQPKKETTKKKENGQTPGTNTPWQK